MSSKILLFAAALTLVAAPALEAQTEVSARGADIRIGGRLHGQFATSSVDGTASQFFFRRARLNADISIGDFWSARIQPDFVGGTATLQDAWVRFNFSSGFRVSVGQFKRAFDMFEVASSSTQLSIIERDGRVDGVGGCAGVGGVCTYGRFTPKLNYAGRDQGVRVEAGSGRLSFLGTVTNGTGTNTADENNSKSFAGRLSFAATEMVTIGGGIAMHDYDDAGETEYGTAWSADIEYGTWTDGLHLQAGVAGGDNWKVDGSPSFMAWQAVATYYAPLSGDRIVGVEPVARISAGDPDSSMDDDGGLVFTPGLMFYVSGRNKFGFNVDFYSPQSGDSEYSFKFGTYIYF